MRRLRELVRSDSAKPAPQSAGTHALPYPVDVRPRDLAAESLPEGGDVAAFDTAAAIAINNARLDHLDGLGLPIAGRSVLDVGGGPGHLAQYFVRAGCPVLSTDARPENVARARELYPELTTGVLDIEADGFAADETYEVVFCYGLLYHVENPLLVLRRLAALTRDLLLLETVITDSVLPLVRVDDETTSFNQALHGIGSRPSPSFVALGLSRAGFAHVYASVEPPAHPDYQFEWRDDLAFSRDGHLLRCVFVASREELARETLVELVPQS